MRAHLPPPWPLDVAVCATLWIALAYAIALYVSRKDRRFWRYFLAAILTGGRSRWWWRCWPRDETPTSPSAAASARTPPRA